MRLKNVGNKISSDSTSHLVIINTSIWLLFLCVLAWARVFASVFESVCVSVCVCVYVCVCACARYEG